MKIKEKIKLILGSLILCTLNFSAQKAKNLEEFGFSPKLEEYRQKVSIDFQQATPTVRPTDSVPEPTLPRISDNYSDLVPPPTQPRSRKYYQPRLREHYPVNREEFTRDREARIRDYKRPPDFNIFLQKHQNFAPRVYGNSEFGLSGLFRTIGADIYPKKTHFFYTGVSRIRFDRALGQRVDGYIEKFITPMGVSTSLSDQFEVALTTNIVNEQSFNFPFVQDFEKTEIEEVMLFSKYQFLDNPSAAIKSAFGFGVQNASGNLVTRRGSDGTSFSGFISVTKDLEKLALHSNLGIVLASGQGNSGNEQPNHVFYNLGLEVPVSSKTRLTAELNGFDWAGFGNNVDLTIGTRYLVREEFSLTLHLPINILRSQFPQDYRNLVALGASIKI